MVVETTSATTAFKFNIKCDYEPRHQKHYESGNLSWCSARKNVQGIGSEMISFVSTKNALLQRTEEWKVHPDTDQGYILVYSREIEQYLQ